MKKNIVIHVRGDQIYIANPWVCDDYSISISFINNSGEYTNIPDIVLKDKNITTNGSLIDLNNRVKQAMRE